MACRRRWQRDWQGQHQQRLTCHSHVPVSMFGVCLFVVISVHSYLAEGVKCTQGGGLELKQSGMLWGGLWEVFGVRGRFWHLGKQGTASST